MNLSLGKMSKACLHSVLISVLISGELTELGEEDGWVKKEIEKKLSVSLNQFNCDPGDLKTLCRIESFADIDSCCSNSQ